MTAASRVAIYARFSTDLQDARSIDDQVRRCRVYADGRNYEVAGIYSDAAQSGAHLDRASMQRLLSDARTRGGSPFEFVLVDDLSRLSRDLGNTWRVVFEDLAAANVKVIDVTTGMASDAPGARLTFGALALVNDTFLQLVRTETHRGLEGRALGGFHTGGRVFGYSAKTEENPPDPEHPRRLLFINAKEAAIVRRIFQLYADGAGIHKIAMLLNADGIPAPGDNRERINKKAFGWSHVTVRGILANERYAGRFVWNKHKYVRTPGAKWPKQVSRPESEWLVSDRPELAIVPEELWKRVHARLAVMRKAGRPHGTGRYVSLFSGILRCGLCNNSMNISASRVRNGRRSVSLSCAVAESRGTTICRNNLKIAETKVKEGVIGALRDLLLAPGHLERFVTRFNARVRELQSVPHDDEKAQLDQELRAQQVRVRNVTQALAHVGWSEALIAQLKEEESRLQALKARASRIEETRAKPLPLPSVTVVQGYVRDLLGTLETDPERGRVLLAEHVGTLTAKPHLDGSRRFYEISGSFDVAVSINSSRGGLRVTPECADTIREYARSKGISVGAAIAEVLEDWRSSSTAERAPK